MKQLRRHIRKYLNSWYWVEKGRIEGNEIKCEVVVNTRHPVYWFILARETWRTIGLEVYFYDKRILCIGGGCRV